MNANPKSTRDVAGEVPGTEMFPSAFATMVHKGVERLADLQKATLDVLNQQTLELDSFYRQAFRGMPTLPGMMFMDLAEQAMGRMVEAEKNIIDIAVKQSAQAMELAKQRTDTASKTAEAMKELFAQSTERAVAVHRIVLDLAAEQNKMVAETVKRQAGVAGTPVARAAETIERGVDTMIETQKEILEAAAKPLKAGTAKA